MTDRRPDRQIRIGTCAWSFASWVGPFYPPHLPERDRLAHYARYFSAIEADSTFYHIPSPSTVAHWLEETPADFLFACKAPREITHERRLRNAGQPLALFLASLEPLRDRVVCILLQLSPSFTPHHDEEALRAFVAALPDDWRFAIEFRHDAWRYPRIAHLLTKHRVCWVWNDLTPLEAQDSAPFTYFPQTADFLYVRLMGDPSTKYTAAGHPLHEYRELLWPRPHALDHWAAKIRLHLRDNARALVFANNHYEGFSPLTCQRLADRLHVPLRLPQDDAAQNSPAARQPELDLRA